MIVESTAEYEIRLPAIRENGKEILPEVTMPKGHYYENEIRKGKRPIIVLNDLQVQRVQRDDAVMSMFKSRTRINEKGQKIVTPAQYNERPVMPARYRSQGDINLALRQENESLKAELRALTGRIGANGVAAPVDDPVVPPPPSEEDILSTDVSIMDASLTNLKAGITA